MNKDLTNADYFAFPTSFDKEHIWQEGLTKREYLAGMAMQGILASGKYGVMPELIAKKSVECADALLDEIERDKP